MKFFVASFDWNAFRMMHCVVVFFVDIFGSEFWLVDIFVVEDRAFCGFILCLQAEGVLGVDEVEEGEVDSMEDEVAEGEEEEGFEEGVEEGGVEIEGEEEAEEVVEVDGVEEEEAEA